MSHEILEPVPDNPDGANIPYRGSVDHGVPFTEVEPTDEAHYYTGRPVEYLPEDKDDDIEPIPVKIVNQGLREIRSFSASNQTFQGLAGVVERTQLVGRDDKRTSVRIKNCGTAVPATDSTIWVGNAEVSAFSGYPLTRGQEITLSSTEPIYAYWTDTAISGSPVNTPGAVVIGVMCEYSERVK